MTRIKINPLYIGVILCYCFSSCATLSNSKHTQVTVMTTEPSYLVINNDTLNYSSTKNTFSVKRSKDSLRLIAFNENISRTIALKAKNSALFWFNLFPYFNLWTGFYIDTKTQKRYTYSNHIYIDFQDTINNYLPYIPEKNIPKSSNIIKFTPYKIFDFINPSIELSFEKRTKNNLSTQLMVSYLLPKSIWTHKNATPSNIKGFRLSLEERFYLKKSTPIGPYIALEMDFLKNKYQHTASFVSISNEEKIYNDTFDIKKHIYTLNYKIGYQINIKQFSFDIFGGLGLRYRDITHFNRLHPLDEMLAPRHPNIYYISNKKDKNWTISIPLNLKIGWLI